MNNGLKELLTGLSETMTDEEFTLSSLQALIASEISTKRQELNMSQKDLADKLGVSQALVSKWESGETNYTLSTLVSIASALGLEMQSPIAPTQIKRRVSDTGVVYLASTSVNHYNIVQYSYA